MNETQTLWLASIAFYVKGFAALAGVILMLINRGSSRLAKATLRMFVSLTMVSFLFGTVYLLSLGGRDGGVDFTASTELRNVLRSAAAISVVVASFVFVWFIYILSTRIRLMIEQEEQDHVNDLYDSNNPAR